METHCDHLPARLYEPGAVRDALVRAEQHCRERGERWTASRARVMELLLNAGAPVKAYDLMASFDEGGAPAKPPTVYRALEFLEVIGLVHRIAGINAFIACDGHAAVHTAAFLICDCCGRADEFDPETAPITAVADANGFVVSRVTLEVRGRCRWCANDDKTKEHAGHAHKAA
jgi:Fur family transcriptional regulator, zinc uptake regulator